MVSRVFRSPHLLGFTRFERSIPADAPMMRRLSNLTQTDMAGQSRTESITAPRSGAHPLGPTDRSVRRSARAGCRRGLRALRSPQPCAPEAIEVTMALVS